MANKSWKELCLENLDRIEKNTPEDMKALPNWCAYKTFTDKDTGKKKKVILDCERGGWASSVDSTTWTTFGKALDYAKNNSCVGLSFALSKTDYTCIDIDNCLDRYKITALGYEVLLLSKHTYCEKSVSGTGLHIFFAGALPDNYKNRNDKLGLEVYNSGRFISITGDVWHDRPLRVCLMPDDVQEYLKAKLGKQSKTYDREYTPSNRTDDDVLRSIRASKKAEIFDRLYSGQLINGDQSRDDFTLLNILAYFTNCDKNQMERLFRSSGLYRESKGPKYITRSIDKAVATLSYTPKNLGTRPTQGH